MIVQRTVQSKGNVTLTAQRTVQDKDSLHWQLNEQFNVRTVYIDSSKNSSMWGQQ